MQKKVSYFIFILLLLPFSSTHAQYIEIGGMGGICSFYGDVNEGVFLANSQPLLGAFVRYNIHPHITSKIQFLKSTLQAKDRASQRPDIRQRNFSFKSDLMEFSLLSEINLLPFMPDQKKAMFAPYIFVGISMIIFNPTTIYDGKTVELQKVGTEGQGQAGYAKPYSLIQAAIPLGLGIKYSISNRINIGLEFGYRFTFTDYLDDVSTVYLSSKQLAENGALAIALSNRTEEFTGIEADELIGQRRGNSNNNDGYFAWGLTISFNLYGKSTYSKNKKRTYKITKWF